MNYYNIEKGEFVDRPNRFIANVQYFEPNRETHPEFAYTLKEVNENGGNILAFQCDEHLKV